MNDWEAINDSKSALEALNKELGKKRDSWTQLKTKWSSQGPVEKKTSSPRMHSSSYLSGAMAESLKNVQPHRECLFEASVKGMKACRVQSLVWPPGDVRQAHAENPDLDHFSTDLAGIPQDNPSARSMVDFSRFLLELSGEKDLASGLDPIRSVDSKSFYPNPHAMKNDRLIR
jgi:hypothetical protein